MADYPEPTWPATPQNVDVDPTQSSACYTRDPYTLTGYLIQFLRMHFSTADNIRRDLLKGYIWDDSVETSKLLIDHSYKVDVRNTMQRPALLVKREEVQPVPVGLGDGQHLSHLESCGVAAGTHKGVDFTNIVRGGHSVTCIGQTGAEAENLGLEVFFHLLEYRYVLKKELNVGKFIVMGLSPLVKMEENNENWSVSVTTAWAYSHDWTIYQDAPILKRVSTVISNT